MPTPEVRPLLPSGLYAIADAVFGDPVELGEQVAALGCGVIQLRAKGWSSRQRAEAARALLGRLAPHGCLLIINDDLEVAVEVGAHGVHLGQDDAPTSEARSRLGPHALIGRSTHSPDQVIAAAEADYLGYGPVFGTRTKDTGYDPRGLEGLAEACRISPAPVVAIGGITPERLPEVVAAGAHGWAVISALWGAPDLPTRVRELRRPGEAP